MHKRSKIPRNIHIGLYTSTDDGSVGFGNIHISMKVGDLIRHEYHISTAVCAQLMLTDIELDISS